nr:tRNA (5-methylaminomethyl-2-thiouridine)(34)-methyltransferase MnmD [Pseudohoeflea sp. DP4N28-3]
MPYSPQFGDHFYARADGRAECEHVFINGNDLPQRWGDPARDGQRFTVAETGFGTGLNFIETWRHWRGVAPGGAQLQFVSFEQYPLRGDEIVRALSAWPELTEDARTLVQHWDDRVAGDVALTFGPVRLEVKIGAALERLAGWEGMADAWYLDGFAPARNPEMWSLPLMQQVAQHTQPGGSFATYTAAGWVRRNLQEAGFSVEKRPGFGSKRDMSAGRLIA